MKKILTLLLAALFLLAAASCAAGKEPEAPGQPHQTALEGYEIKFCVYKEVVTPTPAPVENGEEYMEMVDVRLRAAQSFDEIAASSYSIAVAKLLGVSQDESFYSRRYYDFEIEECIKGDADNLTSVTLTIEDYAFGETSTFIINKDDGYVPPYEIGGRYLLFMSKILNIYSKTEKTSYQLNMNAFSLLDGDNITGLMQQARPYEGAYPNTISLLKEKIAGIMENPEENGAPHGSDFIESEDIKEIAAFAPVIIEVGKKGKADTESSAHMDTYDMELVKIHKGEIGESIRIYAKAENGFQDADGYLLFLSEYEGEPGHYIPASPQGSVIPLSDAERYAEAMGCLYPEEEKPGLFARIREFIEKLLGAR